MYIIRGDKPIVSITHVYTEIPQGNSLNSYLYLKRIKMSCFSFCLFSSAKSKNVRAEQVLPRGHSWQPCVVRGAGKGDRRMNTVQKKFVHMHANAIMIPIITIS
jgi:cephalosporin-C deacetylase-like acetyl esterase